MRDLAAEIAAEFAEAQQLSPYMAEHLRRIAQFEARAQAIALSLPCSCPGCSGAIPVYRPYDRHPVTGRRYCSARCAKRAWRMNHPARARAQNRARMRAYRRRLRVVAMKLHGEPPRPTYELRWYDWSTGQTVVGLRRWDSERHRWEIEA